MRVVFLLLAATLSSGCAMLDELAHEEYIRNTTPNPQNNIQIHGHAYGNGWSLSF